MSKKKRQSRFGDNVIADIQRQRKAAKSYGYLNLPKDVDIFKENTSTRAKLDIIPYIVRDENHPDANPDMPDSALPGNPWYKRPIWVHRAVGVDNESVICPKRTQGKKCPICEYRDKQLSQGVSWEDVKDMRPSLRNLYVVVPVGMKDYEEVMHVWDISQFLFQNQLNDELEERPEYRTFPDPVEGYTLNIRFREKELGANKFSETGRIDFEERKPYDDAVMEEAPCLDEIIEVKSYKELSAIFMEIGEEDIEQEDEGYKDRPTRSLRGVKNLRKQEGDDEEEDEDEEPVSDSYRNVRSLRHPVKTEPEPAPEPGNEKPQAEQPRRRRRSAAGMDKKCPFGHEFGKDWDDFDDCDDCAKAHGDVFDACGDKNEETK